LSMAVMGLCGNPREPGPVRVISIAWTIVIHVVVIVVVVAVWPAHEIALGPLGLRARPIVAVLVVPGSIVYWSLVCCCAYVSDLCKR
jgi:hypothetical protein